MLGWQIIIRKESAETSLASWTTGLGGTDWLDALVKEDKSKDLGGNGYPNSYSAKANEILPLLTIESINSIGGGNASEAPIPRPRGRCDRGSPPWS